MPSSAPGDSSTTIATASSKSQATSSLEDDPRHPYRWSNARKWRVTLVACLVCFVVGINSTAITAAAEPINLEFGESDDNAAMLPVSFWPVTAWNAGASICPMVALPLMEDVGVYKSYILIYVLFCVFVIPQAVANSFATLIITRAIAGSLGGVLQNVIDGIAADVWKGEEDRLLPLTLYVFSLVGGVSFGPVFGGAIISHLSWRWIFYIQLIIYGLLLPITILCLEETRPNIIFKDSKQPRADTPSHSGDKGNQKNKIINLLTTSLLRPLKLLTTEPVIASMTLLSSFAFGLVFLATQSAGAVVFPDVFGFSAANASIVQIALLIGELLGLLACLVQNKVYLHPLHKQDCTTAEEAKLGDDTNLIPEHHLPIAVLGSFLGISIGLFIYGGCSLSSVPWIAPAIGLALVGFGIMCVVQAASLYVTDAFPTVASSAIAGVAFGENLFAAFLPLATDRMYAVLGNVGASCFLGGCGVVLSCFPAVLIWRGRKARRKS